MDVTEPAALDAEELLAAYAAKKLNPLEALQAVTERIARRNPEINAFAVMNPRALNAARASALRWAEGKPLGALDGVPVTVKDLIDVAGLPTRRGSKATDATPAHQDAPLVKALRAAGAVIIGKTATTEFGWKTPGDSPLTGITRNPWNTTHTPGGSSSGAAAAAASFFGPLHVGTDGGGSIRIPAAWSGVVGVKPSFGRVPQWPLGAFGHVAVAGPLARSVRDAALLLSVLAGHDAADPFSLPEPKRDFRAGIEDGVSGLRIGVLQNPGFPAPVDADGLQALDDARRALEGQGATVVEIAPQLPDASAVFPKLWGVALARVVDTLAEDKRALLDPGLLAVAEQFRNTTALELVQAEALRLEAAHAMAALEVDALICPAVPHCAPLAAAPVPDPVAALNQNWAPWAYLFSLTRQPAMTVPMGVNDAGLPTAVQIAAPLYCDDMMLRVARAVERAVG
ncbi:amidase family protein [Acidocella aromatica]|uniref:Aspartyl-tRNA(Asn)/glutamyl-tRNA(Gln) amidotransferase subunit A n=1 Tax=Acidocella aromatica TaxID=1303579 RepID=A0A840VBL4_9PROT|nr:amidase family protein [Acidocella aromatica]MBB5373004.1 aspartyl-tRNA(Asn)/glutamyl-tRNA(Gln) amidotransferase subunit A [Acidocella aromatica]